MKLFRKRKDLQPWVDWFRMMQAYEHNGLLDVMPEKGEAFVTQPALHAMSDGDDPRLQVLGAITATARRIKVYAGWKGQEGGCFIDRPFALHVVKDHEPHDLIYTILITRPRVWWKLWCRSEHVDVISYEIP